MKYLIVLFALTSGCATGTSYITKHGLTVHDNTGLQIPQREVEYIVDRGLKLFHSNKRLGGLYLYLVRGLFYIPYEENGERLVAVADGYTEPGEGINVSVFSQCLAYSSLLHELYHLITGKEHTEDDAFTELPILKQITEQMVKERCSSEDLETEKSFRRNIEGKQVEVPHSI